MDVYDILVERVRELSHARWEASAYKVWFHASLDKLHEQDREIERQRQQIAHLIDENRQLRRPEAA